MKHKTDISNVTVLKISDLPALSVEQMIKVDHLMENEYGISLEQMMENAGRSLASLVPMVLGNNIVAENFNIVIVCGSGNNGGGGMVAARFLHNRGYNVTGILVGSVNNLKPIPAACWRTLNKFPIKTLVADGTNTDQLIAKADLIIDAMIGYGLKGKPRELASQIIKEINLKNGEVIALDIPSGLDGDKGIKNHSCILATATMTLALPKRGLIFPESLDSVGELFLADIGVPPELYERLNLPKQQIFQTPIVKLEH